MTVVAARHNGDIAERNLQHLVVPVVDGPADYGQQRGALRLAGDPALLRKQSSILHAHITVLEGRSANE